MRHDQPPGLAHRSQHRLAVPRPEGAQVDHLHRHALFRQRLGRRMSVADHGRPGDHGGIAALADDPCAAELARRLVLAELFLKAPKVLVLQIDHRIVAADRRLEQAQIVARRRRRDHGQARDMHIPGFQRLRVLRGRRAPHAHRLAHDQRHAALPAEHVAGLRRLVHELVHGAEREIGEAHLHHRARARQRRADSGAEDRGLGNRRVRNPERPEFLRHAGILAEDAAAPEVLAEGPHGRVAAHFLGQRPPAGLHVGCRHHRNAASRGSPTSCTSA